LLNLLFSEIKFKRICQIWGTQ